MIIHFVQPWIHTILDNNGIISKSNIIERNHVRRKIEYSLDLSEPSQRYFSTCLIPESYDRKWSLCITNPWRSVYKIAMNLSAREITISTSEIKYSFNMFDVLSRYLRIRWSSMRSNWMLWLIATRRKHLSTSDQPLKRFLRRIDILTGEMWIWWVLKRRKKDRSPP